jgi:hypothetical protein
MKSFITYLALSLMALYMTGCEDINSLHQKYLDEGETFYTGRVEAIRVYSGNERVKFTWQVNSDPRISRTLIYWNDRKDSTIVEVNRTQSGYIQLETIVNVHEGIYAFVFMTKDNEGNRSLTQERSVQVYGPNYISGLFNRNIQSLSVDGNELTINWAAIESAYIQYTTVRYTDYSNPASPLTKSLRVENEDMQTVIHNIRVEDTFAIVTSYLPEESLDIFDALPISYAIR